MTTFIPQHAENVMGTLNGFDRVRVRGTLRWLFYADGLGKHLSKVGVLLKDFKGYVRRITTRLREATEQMLERAGRRPWSLSRRSVHRPATAAGRHPDQASAQPQFDQDVRQAGSGAAGPPRSPAS